MKRPSALIVAESEAPLAAPLQLQLRLTKKIRLGLEIIEIHIRRPIRVTGSQGCGGYINQEAPIAAELQCRMGQPGGRARRT